MLHACFAHAHSAGQSRFTGRCLATKQCTHEKIQDGHDDDDFFSSQSSSCAQGGEVGVRALPETGSPPVQRVPRHLLLVLQEVVM